MNTLLHAAIVSEVRNRIHAWTDSGRTRRDNLKKIDTLATRLKVSVSIPDFMDREALVAAESDPLLCVGPMLEAGDYVVDPMDGEIRQVESTINGEVNMVDGGVIGLDEISLDDIRLESEVVA